MRALAQLLAAAANRAKAKLAELRAKREIEKQKESPPL